MNTTNRKTLSYLKTYRKRTGIALKDMADIIGIDIGNLSKIEHGKMKISTQVLLSYHVVLNIPMYDFVKHHIKETIHACYSNALELKERLLNAMTTPELSHELIILDSVIDHLEKQKELQGNND